MEFLKNELFMIPVWVQVLALTLFTIFILWLFKSIIKSVFKAVFSKRVVIDAKLVSKVKVPYVTQQIYASHGNVESGLAEKRTLYKFYFEIANKDSYLELNVSRGNFDVAIEGATGKLDYKGDIFYSFDGITEGTVIDAVDNQNEFIGINQHL